MAMPARDNPRQNGIHLTIINAWTEKNTDDFSFRGAKPQTAIICKRVQGRRVYVIL